MRTPLSNRECTLVAAIRRQGYEVLMFDTCVKLHVQEIRGFTSGYDLPWAFRSVEQAAEHLIPIVKDNDFRELVVN